MGGHRSNRVWDNLEKGPGDKAFTSIKEEGKRKWSNKHRYSKPSCQANNRTTREQSLLLRLKHDTRGKRAPLVLIEIRKTTVKVKTYC